MEPRGPVDPRAVPRYAGPSTFARLPRRDEVDEADIAIIGVPFDSGVTYRPGARFGPLAVRAASRLLRGYHAPLDVETFRVAQVVDAGDLAVTPFDINAAVSQIEAAARQALDDVRHFIAIGGDHTIALPLLRAVAAKWGPVAVVHFDAHLDTWDTYFGAEVTHGTPFRRASEEGLISLGHSIHIGIRGPLFSPDDLTDDVRLGFEVVPAMELESGSIADVVHRIRERIGDRPTYVSIDIDVLDPAAAPGTGTPEAGGLTSRELLGIVRGLSDVRIVSADVVEVAPAYDHAEITATAASHVIYELVAILARRVNQERARG
ncbi:MAG: agmatinase [Chloroflexota bacterium]